MCFYTAPEERHSHAYYCDAYHDTSSLLVERHKANRRVDMLGWPVIFTSVENPCSLENLESVVTVTLKRVPGLET